MPRRDRAMVRITSYNIHAGVGVDGRYDLERIASVLKRSACDIACLQEVEINFEERRLRPSSARHGDNQAEELAQLLGFNYYSFAGPLSAYVAETSKDLEESGQRTSCQGSYEEVLVRDKAGRAGFGNAILSRFPILESRDLLFDQEQPPLSEDYIYMDREQQPRGARAILVDTSRGVDGPAPKANDRKAMCMGLEAFCTKQVGGIGGPSCPFWIVSTHLSHKACSEEQRRQARQLIKFIEGLLQVPLGPVKPGIVLCGDLNAAPLHCWSSYSLLSSDPRFRDAWKDDGVLSFLQQSTFPATWCGSSNCGLHLDHVFLVDHAQAAQLECRGIRVVTDASRASTHHPVSAEVSAVR